MLPTVVPVQREIDLHKRTPFWALGFAHEVHAGFVGRVVGLAGVARDARANDVFPSGRPAAVARDDVVEIEIFPVEDVAAVLAGVFVALKDVVARELHFFLRHPVIHEEQDNLGQPDAEGDGVNGIVVRSVGGDIAPFLKIKGAKGAVRIFSHHLGLALEEEGERAAGSADVYSLPEPVQH